MASHAPPVTRTRGSDSDDDDEEDTQLKPPDGGWGWMVVFASFMIHIVTDGVTYSFGIFYLEFLNYFQEGKGKTAWIVSILVGVTLCSGPISSSFVNKYGCRSVTIVGAVMASLCTLVSIYATNVLTLCITIGMGTGFGFGLIYLPAIVSVTCYFERLRSLATGIAVCGSGLGTFIFAPFTEYLIKTFGWRGALIIIAGLMLNCIVLGILFRPLEPPKRSKMELIRQVSRDGSVPLPAIAIDENNENSAGYQFVQVTKSHQDLKVAFVNDRGSNIRMNDVGSNIHRPHSIGNFSQPPSMLATAPLPIAPAAAVAARSSNVRNDTSRMALSQPALLTISQMTGSSQQHLQRRGSGFMHRKDIFYPGSLHNIPNSSRSRSNLRLQGEDSLRYRGETKRLMENGGAVKAGTSQNSLVVHKRTRTISARSGVSVSIPDDDCVLCSQDTRDMLREMLDMSLLRDPIFILFTLSNFLTSIGFYIPYVYIVAQAEARGISKDQSSLLLSVIGIANTIGRVILGYVSDKAWVNRLLVYNMSLAICGIATALSALCDDFFWFAVYSAVFGFTIGAYVGLTSVILVDLLGLDQLTNAFGLLLLFQGIASFLGPPCAGWLYDALGSYDPGFYVAGSTIAVSGIMLFIIPPLHRYLEKRQAANAGAIHL